ncbi:type II secretion system secretin GspD [Bacteriovoracaceae bacterium]|nr:type II secretion system secretin GspD [Bacteriovoracaceae bacterium]
MKLKFLLVTIILNYLFPLNSYSQFEKFKSPSKFNQNETSNDESMEKKDLTPEQLDFVENDYDPTEEGDDIEDDFLEDDIEEEAPRPENRISTRSRGSSNNSSSNRTDRSTFGNRTNNQIIKKNNLTVNLNPETGFGPEIVQSFDFPDTDILDLTKHMQKLTGINLILDKEVKGKVSITAPTAITVGDAWKAYLAALNMANFTLVKSGAFYKVIPSREVRYTPTSLYTGGYTPNTEAHVMKVITLKHVSAEEISRNFRPFMTKYGRLMEIKQTNTIIISDTGINIQRLERLIQFVDVAGHDETLQIIPVRHTSAQEIAKLLDSILQSPTGGSRARSSRRRSSRSSSSSSEQGSGISKIIAEPRTNSIIALANASGAEKLTNLIRKLDVKLISSSSGRVHVYYLHYGNAEELSKTLSSLIQGAGTRQNTTARSGSSSSSRRFSSRNSGSEEDTSIFNADVKITADKNNNAIVVTASPTDWLTLKDVIKKLDIPRNQVYVEGMILETNVSRQKSFGVEWAGAYGAGNAQRGGFITGSDLTTLLSTGNPTSLNGFFIGSGGPETEPKTLEIGGQEVKVNSVNALIKLLAVNGNTNVLATPQILAMDNTESVFEVGETIPVFEQTTANNGATTNQYREVEATLKLELTPQINKATRMIKLNIKQKIDEFKAAPTANGGAPKFTRSAQTEVMIRDRDTIAMGGLLRDREVETTSKVPFLGDIPVLGWLFKNKTSQIEKINLMFFLTPKILAPYATTASKNTRELMERRKRHLKYEMKKEMISENSKNTMIEVLEKVKKQEEGPLFDQAALNYSETVEPTRSNNEEPSTTNEMETPNYQEIVNEISEEKNKTQ